MTKATNRKDQRMQATSNPKAIQSILDELGRAPGETLAETFGPGPLASDSSLADNLLWELMANYKGEKGALKYPAKDIELLVPSFGHDFRLIVCANGLGVQPSEAILFDPDAPTITEFPRLVSALVEGINHVLTYRETFPN